MFNPELVRKINSSRCFALVGSGPSCELGYPAWRELASRTVEELRKQSKISDEASYAKYLEENKYPELFRQAERDLGTREALVSLTAPLMMVEKYEQGFIYDILARWPIACYLTTNYDNEIAKHLQRVDVFYETIGNSRSELATIRHDARGLIVKLHSDFDHPQDVVLTSVDYQRISTSQEGEYFRAKLRSIFEMFDVFIVGHSLSDPDLSLILQIAKQTASPSHPIYLLAAEVTRAEEQELFEKFNIAVIPYKNPDGRHTRLRKMLAITDKFIISRSKRLDLKSPPYSAEEVEAAQSLFIYRRIHKLAKQGFSTPAQYLGPLILAGLRGVTPPGINEAGLLAREPLSTTVRNEEIRSILGQALNDLRTANLIAGSDRFALTEAGEDRVHEIADRKRIEEDLAFGQFLVNLKREKSDITAEQQQEDVTLLKDTLVKVFKQRGIAIANAIFAGQSVDQDDLSDIFKSISAAAASIEHDVGMAFVEAAHAFILEPTEPQVHYLTSLSQGFFLYHLLGLDPNCAKIRREWLAHTVWWCDASVLLPLLAKGSSNEEYAEDLFKRLVSLEANVVTTDNFVTEVFEHLEWAINLFQEHLGTAVFLEAALLKGSYKQNLFLDGYIRLAAEGKVGTPQEYVEALFPGGPNWEGVERQLKTRGVTVVNMRDLEGYKTADFGEINELKGFIRKERIKRDTFRGESQVDAEAEVLHLIRCLRSGRYKNPVELLQLEHTFFLSQSRVLDRISPVEENVTWTPEALYRYLTALPGEEPDPKLLHQCMLQDYYGSGVVLVDKSRYVKFFGPSINAARASFVAEKLKYLREASQVSAAALDKAFDNTPDLEKPFFVAQMGWRVARAAETRAQAAERQATNAEAEIKRLLAERGRKKTARKRQLEAEIRHQKDPKYQQKRRRQAKARRRNKK